MVTQAESVLWDFYAGLILAADPEAEVTEEGFRAWFIPQVSPCYVGDDGVTVDWEGVIADAWVTVLNPTLNPTFVEQILVGSSNPVTAMVRQIAPLYEADPDLLLDPDPELSDGELERIGSEVAAWRFGGKVHRWLMSCLSSSTSIGGSLSALRPLHEQWQRFDPSREVSVSNMPPWDELEFELLPH